MKAKVLQSIILAAVSGLFVAGCGTYAGRAGVVVPGDPPPPPAEVDVTTPMPDTHSVWIGGAWVWGPENRWVWAKGHWDLPPFLNAVWAPPRYEIRDGKHIFVPGQWQ
jgi:hypothetical protein